MMFKKLLSNIKKPTPKTGKGLAGFGLTIAGFGLTASFKPDQLIEFVPENQRIYVALALIIAGVATSIWGGSKVKAD